MVTKVLCLLVTQALLGYCMLCNELQVLLCDGVVGCLQGCLCGTQLGAQGAIGCLNLGKPSPHGTCLRLSFGGPDGCFGSSFLRQL